MNPDPMSCVFEMFRMMADTAQAFNKFATGTSADPAQPSPSATGDAPRRLLQLYLALVNSGYRYLGRWAKISAERYPEMVQALMSTTTDPAARGRELGAAMDGVRAFLREMAELPLDESKRLQTEIEGIMRTGRPAADSTPETPPRRRARAKE